MKILVIEDHDALREVTIAALQQKGHVVRGIPCAEMLNDELQKGMPHILVLDLNLPGENGISLAQRVRAEHPGIGIIMVTARKGEDDRVTGYESGADIYLTKPTSLDELASAITALSRRMTTWAEESSQASLDPRELKSVERARAIRQQLLDIKGKLPTMDELAVQYGCSVRSLNVEFTAEYGLPIHPYIVEQRFSRAYIIMQQTTIPMKVIADQLGYSHVNHFIVAFKKRYGYPPGTLRKQHD